MTQRLDHQTLAPQGMRALGGVYRYLAQTGLPKPLLDLVYLRASQVNGCAFCIATHSKDLLESGMTARKLMLLAAWPEAGSAFTPEECAALRWTDALTLVAKTHAPDDDFAAVSACFTPTQVVDLTIAVGLINAYNRLSIGARRSPDTAS